MKRFFALALVALPTLSSALEFPQCVAEVRRAAREHGVSQRTIDDTLATVSPDERVIRMDRRQPERVLAFSAYRQRLLTPARVRRGREEVAHLATQGRRYAVENELLVALWGVETDFGRVTGDFDTVRALATLACDTRRPAFFRRELLALLQLIDAGQFAEGSPRESWAGAVGQLQILPTVLRRHGRDLDGDGRVTIARASDELFTTAADYLVTAGWRSGEPWGVELALPPAACAEEAKCRLDDPAQWQDRGLRTRGGDPLPRVAGAARVLRFAAPDDRAFLVFGNFEALLRWNRSDKYALVVGLLRDALESPPTR